MKGQARIKLFVAISICPFCGRSSKEPFCTFWTARRKKNSQANRHVTQFQKNFWKRYSVQSQFFWGGVIHGSLVTSTRQHILLRGTKIVFRLSDSLSPTSFLHEMLRQKLLAFRQLFKPQIACENPSKCFWKTASSHCISYQKKNVSLCTCKTLPDTWLEPIFVHGRMGPTSLQSVSP